MANWMYPANTAYPEYRKGGKLTKKGKKRRKYGPRPDYMNQNPSGMTTGPITQRSIGNTPGGGYMSFGDGGSNNIYYPYGTTVHRTLSGIPYQIIKDRNTGYVSWQKPQEVGKDTNIESRSGFQLPKINAVDARSQGYLSHGPSYSEIEGNSMPITAGGGIYFGGKLNPNIEGNVDLFNPVTKGDIPSLQAKVGINPSWKLDRGKSGTVNLSSGLSVIGNPETKELQSDFTNTLSYTLPNKVRGMAGGDYSFSPYAKGNINLNTGNPTIVGGIQSRYDWANRKGHTDAGIGYGTSGPEGTIKFVRTFANGGNTAYESWYRYNTPEGREGIPESYSSYDYQRYYNDAVRGLNPMGFDEGSQHFPDTYKYPWHPSFSDESIYYTNQKETPALSYNTKADWKEYLRSKKADGGPVWEIIDDRPMAGDGLFTGMSPADLGIDTGTQRVDVNKDLKIYQTVADKLQAEEVQGDINAVDAGKVSEQDFRNKYGTSSHRMKYDTRPQYRAEISKNAKEVAKTAGTIDYPSTDIRSQYYKGNPNLNYMVPEGLTGPARAAYEHSQMGVIGMTVPIPGLQAVGKIPSVFGLAGKGFNAASKALGTESGLLSHTYKVNPWRFKANPEAYYHRSPNLENIVNQETGMLQGFGESEAGRLFTKNALTKRGINLQKGANSRLYFAKGTPLDYGRTNMVMDKKTGKLIPGHGYAGPYMVEVEGVPMGASTKGSAPGAEPTKIGSYAVSKRPISLDEAKFYKEDWLRGYKEIPKPTSKKILASGVEEFKPTVPMKSIKDVDFPEYERKLRLAGEAGNEVLDWVKSDEWLKRRMAASGESLQEAQKAQKMFRRNLQKTYLNVDIVDNLGEGTQGIYTKGSSFADFDPRITLKNNPDNIFYEAATHEFHHAANTGTPEYFMKGLSPIQLEDFSNVNPKFYKYLSALPEQQVRGVKALQFLEKSKQWKPGELINEDHIDFLKRNYQGRNTSTPTPFDVFQLANNYKNKSEFVDFLNKVYVPAGAALIGKEVLNDTKRAKGGWTGYPDHTMYSSAMSQFDKVRDYIKYAEGGETSGEFLLKKRTYTPESNSQPVQVTSEPEPVTSTISKVTKPSNLDGLSYDQIQGDKVLVKDFSPKYDYVLSGDNLYYQVKGGKTWANISSNLKAKKNISDFLAKPASTPDQTDMFSGMSDQWTYSSDKINKDFTQPKRPSKVNDNDAINKALIKNVIASNTVPKVMEKIKPAITTKQSEKTFLDEIDRSLDDIVDYAASTMGSAANAWNNLSGNISDLTETGLKGIERKLLTNFGLGEESGADINLPKQTLKPKTLEEYYANKSGNEISATIDVPDNSGRQYKQQALNTSTIKFAPRARGEYKDIETDGLEVTTFSPFTDGKGFKDNQTVLAVDSAGNLQAGSFKDFKGKSGFLFSPTYRNNIMEFSEKNGAQEYVSGEKTGNRKYTHPKVKVLDDSGKEVDGLLNILVQNDTKKNFYGSIQGGRVLFVNPDTKEQRLVSGSMNYIKSKFNELKGKSKYLEAYTLDNGTYSRGLSYKDKKLTKDRLRSYDNENTSGGNGLYIVSYNEPVNRFEEKYVATPNVRTEKDESYKKGHALKNEIKNVVLHHTAYTDAAANEEQVRKQYMTPGANTSHVVIEEDGKRVVYASPEQVTFHAGTSRWKGRDNVNDFSIGVEFQGDTQVNPLTNAQIESFVEYYDPIAKRYGLTLNDLITHQMIRDEYLNTYKGDKNTASKPDITKTEYKRILDYMKSKGYKKRGGLVTGFKYAKGGKTGWQLID